MTQRLLQFSLLTSYNTHPDSAHEPPSERTISEITFPMIEQRSGALSSSLRGRKDKVLSMSLYPFFASNTMRSFACLCKLTACVSAPAPSVCLCAPGPVQVSGREYDNLAHSCNAFRRARSRDMSVYKIVGSMHSSVVCIPRIVFGVNPQHSVILMCI